MASRNFTAVRQFGKYAVQRRLGSGAGSVIFEVTDPAGDTYALKRILKRTFSDERFFRQAENEFTTGRQIDHAVIRKMYELNRVRSFFRVREMHLLMEMFDGQTLEAQRPRDLLTTVQIFRQAAEGLSAMHAVGFVHADIKPNNILVGLDGRVKIIDLGQSCPVGTVKQRIQGTPDYIAPEQVHRRPIDQRTDVFNLGATLYWTLTAQHVPTVLPKTQPGREIALVTSAVATPPDQVNSQVPPALSRLAMECVNVPPVERPADMKELRSRLEMIELIMSKDRTRAAGNSQSQVVDRQTSGRTADSQDDDTVDLAELGLDEAI